MSDPWERIRQDDLPYTVVAHTAIPKPSNSITLTAEGIIELANRVKPGDLVQIKNWSDYAAEGESVSHYQRITVLRKKHHDTTP